MRSGMPSMTPLLLLLRVHSHTRDRVLRCNICGFETVNPHRATKHKKLHRPKGQCRMIGHGAGERTKVLKARSEEARNILLRIMADPSLAHDADMQSHTDVDEPEVCHSL